MTTYLQAILGKHDPLFTMRVQKLESVTGYSGVDIRLTQELQHDLHEKMKLLQLDPFDTTAAEMYHALATKAKQDDVFLLKQLGMTTDSSSSEILIAVAKLFSKDAKNYKSFAIKKTAIKTIFKSHPPKRVMKLIHARSVDSLLKRESVLELYALAMGVESENYIEKLREYVHKLTIRDFEEVSTQIIAIQPSRWKQLQKNFRTHTSPVVTYPEIGAVMIVPLQTKRTTCLALVSAALLALSLRQCKTRSSYIKVVSLDPSFRHKLHTAITRESVHITTIHEMHISWKHIHKLHANKLLPYENYGLHIEESDLTWLQIEALLAKTIKGLDFWIGTHRLAFVSNDKQIVSLHIADVGLNVMFNHSLDNMHSYFVTEQIHDELVERYLQLPPLKQLLERETYKITDTQEDMLYA